MSIFNGKELQEETGYYDYGWKQYDPLIARWTSVDPKADIYQHWSPYNYGADNPITNTDPTGTSIEDSKRPGHATRYVDPNGNEILNTNDGRNDVYVVPWDKRSEFEGNVALWQDRNSGVLNSQQWNNYWRGEFVLSDYQWNHFAFGFNFLSLQLQGEWIKQFITNDPADREKFQWGYVHSQWSDPVVVVGSLLAFAHAGVGLAEDITTPKYAGRVRARGVEDPTSHNFPYSYDGEILSTKPKVTSSGYKIYTLKGSMNGKQGVFEIGVNKSGIIDHRFFRPGK
jgi:RHS repeat-associated protein